METKKVKDELIERVVDNLKKWGEADMEKHSYILLANVGNGTIRNIYSCSMKELILMLGIAGIETPEIACAVKKLAHVIDIIMQSEPTYQKLKDDNDFSESEKDRMFITYFKQATKNPGAALSVLFSEIIEDSDDEANNEQEQS